MIQNKGHTVIHFCILFIPLHIILGAITCLAEDVATSQFPRHNFFKNKTKILDPFSLRDPFKEPLNTSRDEDASKTVTNKDGVFTNLPTIEDVPLSDIAIVGVLIGKERRALAVVRGGLDKILIKEGMFLGKDNAEIKAILPGGIVLVEKIINVYGQEEYLETVMPITDNPFKKNKDSNGNKPDAIDEIDSANN